MTTRRRSSGARPRRPATAQTEEDSNGTSGEYCCGDDGDAAHRACPWCHSQFLGRGDCLRGHCAWANANDREASFMLLKREDVGHSIRALLMASNAAWLPRFFRDLLSSDIADGWLVDLATEARHPAIRARSTIVLVEGKVDRLVEFRSLWRNPLRNPVRPVDTPFDIEALISAGARDRTVAVRKAAAEGLVRHFRRLPDVAELMETFGAEKNTVIRNRLDFIRRQLAAE
jgi:hypothetical protein